MSELLDEIARALSKPMPRSRALRLVGGALVAAAVPRGVGRGTGVARAATSTTARRSAVCGYPDLGGRPDEFQCPGDVTDTPTSRTCGPKRSGAFDCCGALGPKCCTDGTFGFPADQGGHYCCPQGCDCYKGLCCPPAGERGADAQGRPVCCARGEILRDGRCFPRTCGPDVTDALDDVLGRTRTAFRGWSSLKRAVACTALVQTPIGASGWEINQLGPGSREEGAKNFQPECATCTKSLSVQVDDGCHYAGSVNYVVYGVMLRLCHDHLEQMRSTLSSTYSEEQMALYVTIWKVLHGAPNLTASLKWARAGYHDWPESPTPRPELPVCAECPKELRSRLTVRWAPLDLSI
jgi:hypothetical protein